MKQAGSEAHYSHILATLVDKLPMNMVLAWAAFQREVGRKGNLDDFVRWLMRTHQDYEPIWNRHQEAWATKKRDQPAPKHPEGLRPWPTRKYSSMQKIHRTYDEEPHQRNPIYGRKPALENHPVQSRRTPPRVMHIHQTGNTVRNPHSQIMHEVEHRRDEIRQELTQPSPRPFSESQGTGIRTQSGY